MTKLTLSVDESVVKKAKQVAHANRTSVSAMFSRFIQATAASEGSQEGHPIEIGPLTRKLSGIVELPPGEDDKEMLTDALLERHGLTP